MERGMVVCEECGGHGEVRSARFTPEATCDLEACPVCHGRGIVRGEQLTPAMVREGLAAVVGVSGPTVRRALKGGVCTPLVARALAELVATTPEAPQRAA